MVRFTHPDGVNIGYAYDSTGRTTLVQEVNPAPSLDDLIVRYWYNAAGSRHSAVRGAGTGGFYTVYYRDPLERLTILANDLPGTANDAPVELGYNAASQIVTRVISNDAYAAPPEVNRSLAYQVNGLNQYTAASNRTYVYDANGNLTSDGTTTYTYDVENRLISASGATNATLVYDPLGRLVQTSSPAGASTYFYYDRDRVIAEYDGAGNLAKRYVYGPQTDEPVVVYEGPALGLANRRYLLPDERGSIAALINADGTPSVINRYDSWGIPGAGNQGRFQYTGQAWIPELGMYHYKARLYSPILGRFMQTDPIGYEDQINLYAYVGNDPINATDPDGTQTMADPRAGAIQQVGEYFAGIASDLGDLAGLVAEGDFDRAFGGMPPTLGGGLISGGATVARNIPTVVTGTRLANQTAAAHRVARAEAAAARAGGNAKGATSGLVTRSGQTFTGRSTHAGGPGRATNARVDAAVQAAPKGPYPGCCAEVNAVSGTECGRECPGRSHRYG